MQGTPGAALSARPARPVLTLLTIAAVVLAVDQLTKIWAVANLDERERIPVVGDLLGLTLLYNPGAALSFAAGMTWVFTVAAVLVAVVILRVARRLGSRTWTVALGLLLGGAVGNLVDRLVREPGFPQGHVVDFIAYADWFVGNVADIAIVVAAGLIVLMSLRGVGVDGVREADRRSSTSDDVAEDEAGDEADAENRARPGTRTDASTSASAETRRGPGEAAGTDEGGRGR